MSSSKKNKYAVWAITPNGVDIAQKIAGDLSDVEVFLSDKVTAVGSQSTTFQSLSAMLAEQFCRYAGHVFIMSAGIVVRIIAPLIQSKVEDPAVVVVDDRGKHAISLLSGHIGGANDLAVKIAACIHANPVISTATDVNQIAAIDVLAKEKQLFIENPHAIKIANMALLKREKIRLHDPFGCMQVSIPDSIAWPTAVANGAYVTPGESKKEDHAACVFIDDVIVDLPPQALILRPPTLMAGIGCNRNTTMEEMQDHLERVFEQFQLALGSLAGIASIQLKADETGLLALAKHLGLPLYFYDKEELNQVQGIKNPSSMVEKHIGVKSVCEAAAIIAAQNGTLVVPKQTNRNVTTAVARIGYTSLA